MIRRAVILQLDGKAKLMLYKSCRSLIMAAASSSGPCCTTARVEHARGVARSCKPGKKSIIIKGCILFHRAVL